MRWVGGIMEEIEEGIKREGERDEGFAKFVVLDMVRREPVLVETIFQ